MYQVHRWGASIVGGALLALSPLASAADVAADYSTVLNPNGVWSYGEFLTSLEIPAGLNQLHPSSTIGAPWPPTVHAWHQPFAMPLQSSFVSAELAGAPTTLGTTAWTPGLVLMRPGVNDQAPFVSFRAPIAGVYAYTVTYAPADVAGGTRRVFTLINGAIVHLDPLIGPIGGVIPVTHSNAVGVPLAAGDTIKFVLSAGGSPGDYEQDAVALRNAQVSLIAGPITNKPCRWVQPWTRPLATHQSVVADCAGRMTSFAPIAMDDFRCDEDAQMRRVTWWGTTVTQFAGAPTPPQRLFFIRVWTTDPTNCQNLQPIFQDCVLAKSKMVGIDCQNNRVFRFSAMLNSPFAALAGEVYYLQISEVDDDPNNPFNIFPTSAHPGLPDFAWSAHRPIRLCPALQIHPSGAINQPLLDPCDGREDDLAFTLAARITTITVRPILATLPPLRVQLREVGTGRLVEEVCETQDPETGELHVEFEAPDGTYDMCVFGGASVGVKEEGVAICECADPDPILLSLGDGDNSGKVAFPDINAVLAWWLSMRPMMPNGEPN